ncbi:hypothetical protein F5X99DRAFT_428657 [Biscogniauxia marginata]|nr:hypothetical protein F5X99DRAFT_428657 [Biscogniauxia marginata]
MAYSPRPEFMGLVTDPSYEAYKRALAQEKLAACIAALHTFMSSRYVWLDMGEILKEMYDRLDLYDYADGNTIVALLLSSKIILSGLLIRPMHQFLDKDTTLVSRALDPNRPPLFTPDFVRRTFSYIRGILKDRVRWGSRVDRILAYNEKYYNEADEAAFRDRHEHLRRQEERDAIFQSEVNNVNMVVVSQLFKESIRYISHYSAVYNLYRSGPQAAARLEEYIMANHAAGLQAQKADAITNKNSNSGGGNATAEKPWPSALLMSTFLRLHDAGYFSARASKELWELRKKAGFPMLGDMVFSPRRRLHREFLYQLIGEMDLGERQRFWSCASILGIPQPSASAHIGSSLSIGGDDDDINIELFSDASDVDYDDYDDYDDDYDDWGDDGGDDEEESQSSESSESQTFSHDSGEAQETPNIMAKIAESLSGMFQQLAIFH